MYLQLPLILRIAPVLNSKRHSVPPKNYEIILFLCFLHVSGHAEHFLKPVKISGSENFLRVLLGPKIGPNFGLWVL